MAAEIRRRAAAMRHGPAAAALLMVLGVAACGTPDTALRPAAKPSAAPLPSGVPVAAKDGLHATLNIVASGSISGAFVSGKVRSCSGVGGALTAILLDLQDGRGTRIQELDIAGPLGAPGKYTVADGLTAGGATPPRAVPTGPDGRPLAPSLGPNGLPAGPSTTTAGPLGIRLYFKDESDLWLTRAGVGSISVGPDLVSGTLDTEVFHGRGDKAHLSGEWRCNPGPGGAPQPAATSSSSGLIHAIPPSP